jgi:penicillin amidase
MRWYYPRLLLAAVVLGALGYLGSRGAGPLPALGPLLDPATGAWALARTAEFPARSAARIAGLGAPVQVVYDDRGVPHIFAASEEDAWRAQGYVVARDRLFQLELQTRAGSGTLSEWFGARALEADRTTRRRGFPWAAERAFAALDSASLIGRAVRAYAQGVNAWQDQLRPTELPLEYRLLQVRPGRWRPIDTFFLFLQMGYTLAWDDQTFDKQAIRGLVGAAAAEALFPLNNPIQEPIQPNGSGAPRYDVLRPFPPPGAPDTALRLAAREQTPFELALGWAHPPRSAGDAIGSNNWVVAPRRTAGHAALLAGDPHLELSLPSVWYEVHLHVAGGTDVAGVSFPGAPGVIIGFNRAVAWSFTNTGADVRDHYQETVDDALHPARYQVDGAWRPVRTRIELLRGMHGELLATDTLYFTHRGTLTREGNRWLSTRWTIFEAGNPGEDFLRLDRAATTREWLDGWQHYSAAAQNGAVADRQGSIALRSTGNFPLRPGDGRGDVVRDGATSRSDWTGFLPLEAYPFGENPAQGFLASANQQPIDPRVSSRSWLRRAAPWPTLPMTRCAAPRSCSPSGTVATPERTAAPCCSRRPWARSLRWSGTS